jgi:hypothetical protein
MEGSVTNCNLESSYYDAQIFIKELHQKYGFEQIGEGGFGLVLGANACTVKIVKDIKRCKELKYEKSIYEKIESIPHEYLLGRIPKFNLYHELTTYCHFNLEKIFPPLSAFDEGDKQRVGYALYESDDTYFFKDIKPKRGVYEVNQNTLHVLPWRKIIHFYINHYDPNFKYKDDSRGDIMGFNALVNSFTQEKVAEYCFAIGQLISFIILDCGVFPFDVELVLGTNEHNRVPVIYMYDFNEATFIPETMSMDLVASTAARSLHLKDGKHYYPNQKNPFYNQFYNGLIDNRSLEQIHFIDSMLQHYNHYF